MWQHEPPECPTPKGMSWNNIKQIQVRTQHYLKVETPAWVNGVVELVAPNCLSRSMWKAQSESRRVRVQQIPGTHWPARLAKMVAPGPAYLKRKVERLDADVPLWPSTQEAKTGRPLKAQNQPCLHITFQASQDYKVKLCLKNKTKFKKK